MEHEREKVVLCFFWFVALLMACLITGGVASCETRRSFEREALMRDKARYDRTTGRFTWNNPLDTEDAK